MRAERSSARVETRVGKAASGDAARAGVSVQVALMSGRSDPSDARPSASQAALLAAVALPRVRVLDTNFPWPAPTAGHAQKGVSARCAPVTPVPLWRACVRNAAQYARSRRPSWRARHRPGVEAWIGCADRTVLLCGSCGLELLSNLCLSPAHLARIHVFAWGPVARELPAVRTLELVQGRADRLSRLWVPRERIDHWVDAGHMDYLLEPEVLERAQRFVERVRDGALAHTSGPCA